MNFHFTVTTEKSLQEAMESLESSLQNHKFGVLWKLDVPAKLREKGVEANFKFHVMEVCNPNIAKQFISEEMLVGYFMPCRVVVYEKDGMTHMGLVKPSALFGLVDDHLSEKAKGVDEELVAAIQEAR